MIQVCKVSDLISIFIFLNHGVLTLFNLINDLDTDSIKSTVVIEIIEIGVEILLIVRLRLFQQSHYQTHYNIVTLIETNFLSEESSMRWM